MNSGEYASESEVVCDGLRDMMARDQVVESWLHSQVARAYDALKADTSRAIAIDDVRTRLAAEYRKSK